MQKKKKGRESPQGGWGMGSKEPIQNYFLLQAVKISEKWYNFSFFLYKMNPRAYKVQKLKIPGNGETPGGFRMAQKSLFGQHLLFSVIRTKNQQAY